MRMLPSVVARMGNIALSVVGCGPQKHNYQVIFPVGDMLPNVMVYRVGYVIARIYLYGEQDR